MNDDLQTLLPTTEEIAPDFERDLDQREALYFFYNKTSEEVAEALADNASERIYHYDSIGPEAFSYYLPAISTYIKSVRSSADVDFIDRLVGVFARRVVAVSEVRPEALAEIASNLCFCIENFQKFDNYGDNAEVRDELVELSRVVEKLRRSQQENGSGKAP